MQASSPQDLLKELVESASETEWVEFKVNNERPDALGQLISALSNAAALHQRHRAFIAWGVKDKTLELVGTRFDPKSTKIGNQELENWLTTQLRPRVQFWIRQFRHDGRQYVIFEIEPASHSPIAFKGREYIRVGTYVKPLSEHPEKERVLWKLFQRKSFESGIAERTLQPDEVLAILDADSYHELLGESRPSSPVTTLQRLKSDALIEELSSGYYNVTNLGAILFARDLRSIEGFARKAMRVIFYDGDDRRSTLREVQGIKGYAIGFAGLVEYITDRLPESEEIRRALRKRVPMYPEIAIRELVANALIHQDFDATGTGPMVEVFENRIEITNPGTPLIDIQRFLDLPPRSRNDALASLMRRLGICEERGSGIDKVLFEVEVHQLPPPDFQAPGEHTRVILLGPKDFTHMSKAERIRACYQHAGLQHVSNKDMTNSSLRKRLSIEDHTAASRVISDTLAEGLIRPYDPSSTSKRYAKYVPFWA